MLVCGDGHTDIARMILGGEYHANIDIQYTVSDIVRVLLCGDVQTCAYLVFVFVAIVCMIVFIIAP